MCLRSETKYLKEGEDQKTKTYTALCNLPPDFPYSPDIAKKIESISNLELDQRTPIRVLHRRPNAIRKRFVYEMKAFPVSDRLFKLELKTQAGTYVKEFVHGDFKRYKQCLLVASLSGNLVL